jgi:hypothetical protein
MPKKQGSDAGKKASKNSKKDDDAAAKPSKASKKAARAAAEAERARDVERMLAPASDAETESEGEWTTDKAGNTISKAEARRKEEEEAMRAAAKKRRAAKASAAPAAPVDEGRPQWLVDYDRVKAKAEAGGASPSRTPWKSLRVDGVDEHNQHRSRRSLAQASFPARRRSCSSAAKRERPRRPSWASRPAATTRARWTRGWRASR